MDMDWRSNKTSCRNFLALALGVTMISQVALTPALSMSLFSSSSKKKDLAAPVYEKLNTGATPTTNDLQSQEATMDEAPAKPADLSPIKVSDEPKSEPAKDEATTASGEAKTEDAGLLKTEVSKNGFVPKEPVADESLASTSVIPDKDAKPSKGGKGKKTLTNFEKAQQVNAMPVPLQASAEESERKATAAYTAEQQQLADLWDATLSRSQDIQFVIQKLMPTNNSGHMQGMVMKMISTTMYGGMSAMMMAAPNAGSQMGMNAGASMMYQALNGLQSNKDKKMKVSQEEAIMLYRLVRDTADKVVDKFREYKKTQKGLVRANEDLEFVQQAIVAAKINDKDFNSAKQIDMNLTVRKAQGDLEEKTDEVRHLRQNLVDLAGADAVEKLDNQMEQERQMALSATSTTDTASAETTPSAETATPVAEAPKDSTDANPETQAAQTASSPNVAAAKKKPVIAKKKSKGSDI